MATDTAACMIAPNVLEVLCLIQISFSSLYSLLDEFSIFISLIHWSWRSFNSAGGLSISTEELVAHEVQSKTHNKKTILI
ncbi:hypothetical protein [Pseudoalteromonas sp. MTN2-4]|uniref:hypothetical protein n=1 Tax=Pseudoalteromonas sp. MTN2-4 TaxID=3056555 RepID=UPI0036F3E190